ncbi:ATP-binding protein [Natroniella sulfidigena]|uniref:sensor histidine kinase n=1 Tax=Natroniella sulfidigena TaxID=723921 RepID=UPI00200A9842|nr:ATP-binding protein [Natroniella sulfidigena]MCK8816652.1 ATP-binding protein [Natroniella sulfidigena]
MHDFNKFSFKTIIIVLLAQTFLLLLLSSWRSIGLLDLLSSQLLLDVILLLALVLSVLSIVMVKKLVKLNKFKTDFKVLEIKMEENQKLIKSLRQQKHDFSNHLQTLYGMLQLKKQQEAEEYIKSLSQELAKLKFGQTNLADSVLDSILIPKKMKAVKEGVDFEYQVEEGIEQVHLPLNKVFRIISNLIDNALDATKEYKAEKKIKVKGIKKEDEYLLSVYNTGPIIPDELMDKIFMAGFSTKGEDRGFGLHIIESLVAEAGGELTIKSEEGYGTEFNCRFSINKMD